MRHFLAAALVLLTASIAFAQSPSTPATQVDEVAAAVPNRGGWCEGKSDTSRGSNFGRCFGSVAKTQTGSIPEAAGSGDSAN